MPAIEEIDWEPKPTLRPGMDFHDETTFFTIPLTRNLVRHTKPKKGEEKGEAIAYKELQTFVITSAHRGFWYDEEALDVEGYLPSEHVYQERETRWSLGSARGYLDGKVEVPDTNALFTELRRVYTTYVEYADETYFDLMALYLMYTYVFRLFESTGYIHFNGTMASGKSRNLSIIDTLAFNSVWASSMSAASLYRKLAGSPGTTCIDESEGFEGERGEDLRRVLNAGYKDGAKAIRTEKGANDRYMPVEYDVFGPKALASINPLEDVIASRCLIVAMRPAIRQLPDFKTKDQQWHALRDQLYLWALGNADRLAAVALTWEGEKKERLAPKLMARQWETSSQFVVLADYVGGEEFATKVIEFLNGYYAKQQEAMNATDRLRTTLRCLPRVLETKVPHPGHLYSVKDIHEVVASYMETDATEYFKTKHVTKNLDVLGFKHKVRASGGLQIELDEAHVRREFTQRRVDPFEEDVAWLAGTTSYQDRPPSAPVADVIPEEGEPWWETTEDNER